MSIGAEAGGIAQAPWSAQGQAAAPPFLHDPTLMIASFALATAAAWAALELSARGRLRQGRAARVWLAGAGALFGTALTGVHLLALIALETPLMRGFELPATLVSALLPLAVGAVGFAAGGVRPGALRFFFVSAWLAHGVPVMHYLGVWGLAIDAEIRFSPASAAVMTIGALAYCALAYWAAHKLAYHSTRLSVALALAAAMAALHYGDIAATSFLPQPRFSPAPAPEASAAPALMVGALIGCAILAALTALLLDLRRETRFAARPRPAATGSRGPGGEPGEDGEDRDGVIVIPLAARGAAARGS